MVGRRDYCLLRRCGSEQSRLYTRRLPSLILCFFSPLTVLVIDFAMGTPSGFREWLCCPYGMFVYIFVWTLARGALDCDCP